jgi:hypothetical protein
VAMALLALLVLCGSPATLVALLPHPSYWLLLHPKSWTDLNYTGPWYQFFGLLWNVGPITAAMALAGLIAIALGKVERTPARESSGKLRLDGPALVVAAIAGIHVAFLSFGPALQCLRLMSPADGCYALLAAVGLTTLLAIARDKLSRFGYQAIVALAVLAVAIEGLCNYRVYTGVVVNSGMEDLAVSGFRYWLR